MISNEIIDAYERMILNDEITWEDKPLPTGFFSHSMTLPTLLMETVKVGPQLTPDCVVTKYDDPFLNYCILATDGTHIWATHHQAPPNELRSIRPNDAIAYASERYTGMPFEDAKAQFIEWDRKNRDKPDPAHPFEDWGSKAVRENGVIVALENF